MSPFARRQGQHPQDFYAAAVYGSIIAAALLGAFRKEHDSAETVLLALVSTLAVFWVAHVWSTIVGGRVHAGAAFEWSHGVEVARAEWPLVEAAFLPSLALVAGWAGVVSRDTAVNLAMAICIVQLLGWGIAVGRRSHETWGQAAVTGAVNGALGIVIVALELVIVH